MTELSFFQLATQPRQYDSKDVDWTEEGSGEDSIRRMLLEAVFVHTENVVPASAHLDLGCGTGWLCAAYARDKSLRSLGIDASVDNIKGAKAHYTQPLFRQADFVQDSIDGNYDLITAVMSFEHVGEAPTMLEKVASLLEDKGKFILVHGDYDYFTRPRFDVKVAIEPSHIDGQVATKTNYGSSFGTLYDIIRRPAIYRAAAESAGLTVTSYETLAVPEWLIEERPEYAIQRDEPMFRLMVAEKR